MFAKYPQFYLHVTVISCLSNHLFGLLYSALASSANNTCVVLSREILRKLLNYNKNQLQGVSFKGCHKVRFSTREKNEKKKRLSHFPVSPPEETKDNNNKISYTRALRPMDSSSSRGDVGGC
jgi:hypothetical protein